MKKHHIKKERVVMSTEDISFSESLEHREVKENVKV